MEGSEACRLVYRTEASEGDGMVDVPFMLTLSSEGPELRGLGLDGKLLDAETAGPSSNNGLSGHQAAVLHTCIHYQALVVPELQGDDEEARYPGLDQLLRVNGSPSNGWKIASEGELNGMHVKEPAAAAFTAHSTPPPPPPPAQPQTSLLPQVLGFVVSHAAQQEEAAAAAAAAQHQGQPNQAPLLKPQAKKPAQGLHTPASALTGGPWLPAAGHTTASKGSGQAAGSGRARLSARLAARRKAVAARSASAASGTPSAHSHSPQLSQQAPAPAQAQAQAEGSGGEPDAELQELRSRNWELRARAVELREQQQKLASEQTLLALRRRQRRELEERVDKYRGMLGGIAAVLNQGPF